MQPFSTDPNINPFYYLDYLDYLLAFVAARYTPVLKAPERRRIKAFQALPKSARALYTRLLQRKGDYFRVDKLNYREIPDLQDAVEALIKDKSELDFSMQPKKTMKYANFLNKIGDIPAAKSWKDYYWENNHGFDGS